MVQAVRLVDRELRYGANLRDEQAGLFPGAEVASPRGLAPVDDRGEPKFGPSAGGVWYLLREDGASSRYGDGLAARSG
jgi:hypothetical protein